MPATSLKILEDELSFEPVWAPGSGKVNNPKSDGPEFGDGYRQLVPSGINPDRRVWRMQLQALEPGEQEELGEFERYHGSHKRFLWQPPGYEGKDPDTGAVRHVKARLQQMNTNYLGGGLADVTLTIEEEF